MCQSHCWSAHRPAGLPTTSAAHTLSTDPCLVKPGKSHQLQERNSTRDKRVFLKKLTSGGTQVDVVMYRTYPSAPKKAADTENNEARKAHESRLSTPNVMWSLLKVEVCVAERRSNYFINSHSSRKDPDNQNSARLRCQG